MDNDMRTRILRSFRAQNMMTTLGAEMTEIAPGAVTIEAPILDIATQQQGYGHAGLTFSIGDSAGGYAALTLMPPDHEVVTAEIKINLLAPAVGERLIARGRVIRPGKRLSIITSEVHARQGDTTTLVAILQGTMVPVSL
jgi:uncharacterized protein (TIGR00369 family)